MDSIYHLVLSMDEKSISLVLAVLWDPNRRLFHEDECLIAATDLCDIPQADVSRLIKPFGADCSYAEVQAFLTFLISSVPSETWQAYALTVYALIVHNKLTRTTFSCQWQILGGWTCLLEDLSPTQELLRDLRHWYHYGSASEQERCIVRKWVEVNPYLYPEPQG